LARVFGVSEEAGRIVPGLVREYHRDSRLEQLVVAHVGRVFGPDSIETFSPVDEELGS
jgi:hypothetical protein